MEERSWDQLIEEKIQLLESQLSEKNKSKFQFMLLKKLVARSNQFKDECGDCLSFQEILDSLCKDLLQGNEMNKKSRKSYQQKIDQMLRHFREVHQLFEEDHYKKQFMILGMIFGVAIGVSTNNIAIGIGAGMAIGIGIGAAKDKETAKQNRVI